MSNFQIISSNNEKHSFLSALLSPLFEDLASANKVYCVCGNYEKLPYYTNNDVDIWTNEPEYIVDCIEKICIDLDYIVYLKNTNATGSNLFICTKNKDAREIIHIDVLRECRWYGFLPLVDSELMGQRKILYKNFYVADDTIDNVMHMMYPLAHFSKIPTKYREPIKRAASSHDFWEIVRECWGKSFCDTIQPLISDDEWEKVEEEFTVWKKKLIWRSLRRLNWSNLKALTVLLYSNFIRIIKPSGLFVVFVGPDGCGKTTVQSDLDDFFKKGFTKGKIRKFYWRPFLLPRISSFIPFKKDRYTSHTQDKLDENPANRIKLRNAKLVVKFLHCLKLLYYWADYLLGRLLYQAVWSRGGVVCFDRYWDDLRVFPERFGISVPEKFVSLLGRLIPYPDIIIYLDVPAEVLISRKEELPYEEVVSQIEHYRNLSKNSMHICQIDGNRPKDEVLKDVIKACINKMSKRYRPSS